MTTSTTVEQRRLRARRAFLALSTVLCSGLAAPAFAQATYPYRQVDANGVDLTYGDYVMAFEEGAIGSGKAKLALVRQNMALASTQWDAYSFHKTGSGTGQVIEIGLPGGRKDRFVNLVSTSALGNGATLTKNTTYDYIYTASDGSTIEFTDPTDTYDAETTVTSSFCGPHGTTDCSLLPVAMATPDGTSLTLAWDLFPIADGTGGYSYATRLAKVSNTYGYAVAFTYQDDSTSGSTPSAGWQTRSGARFYNTAVSTTAIQASVGYTYPSSGVVDITDMAGNVWEVTASSIKRPGDSSPSFSVSSPSAVTAVTKDGVTTSYARTVSGSTATMTVTDALSHPTTIVSNLTVGRPTTVTDALSHATSYTYDTYGRLTRVTQPEGNYVNYLYDTRGNVTETRVVAKSGSGVADIVSTANYASTCSNAVICNLPTYTTDARGNTTNFSYSPTTGAITVVTAPAPTTGATRPETRYTYAGTFLTGVSMCQTTASCLGLADEVKTTIGYDSNGNITSVAKGAGDSSLTATTTATYTPLGDVATVDGPLAGTADTTTFRYNAARRLVGAISADPDGSGPLKRRAQKTTYDTAGRATVSEIGTVNGTADTDWSAFASAQAVTTTFVNSRKAKDVLSAGSTTYQVSQYSYDADGRPECTALRMNSAVWSSLPSSACTLGTTGTAGPDRIGKTTYDYVGRATKTQSGYGTPDQADDATGTYNNNGTLATLTDGNANTTTYEYDGDDRLSKTRYPSPATTGTSSTTDYEQLVYDTGSNVTGRRLRGYASDSTKHIDYSYDALNRVVSKVVPSGLWNGTYTYDLLNRPLSASSSVETLTFGYDALGRILTQTGEFGTLTSTYDVAGRRTQLAYPGSPAFAVTYGYLVTGEMSTITDNASTPLVLATYGYDDLGRKISLALGDGTTTTYTPDAVSRLSSLALNVAGTANDLTLGFAYSPASQISSTTRSNDAFAWTAAANRNDASGINGLNQATNVGSTSISYDAQGNLITIGANTFGYTEENLLRSGPNSTLLSYDPLLRLKKEGVGATPATRFQYDGSALVSEFLSGGSLQKRYVHGAGVDEPLVEYNASGTRTWLHADERGSIVARTDDTGAVTTINSYDEYGVPAAGNVGRFGYTGQAWLPSLSLWYYKARMYAPGLGRFMQTDPIGYGDGMNWYGYVGSDPVNSNDPGGTCHNDLHGVSIEWYRADGSSDCGLTPEQASELEKVGRGLAETHGGSYSNDTGAHYNLNDINVVAHGSSISLALGGSFANVGMGNSSGASGKTAPQKTQPQAMCPPGVAFYGRDTSGQLRCGSPPPKTPPPPPTKAPGGLCPYLPSSLTYGRVSLAEAAVAPKSGPFWGPILGTSSMKDGAMGELVHDFCE